MDNKNEPQEININIETDEAKADEDANKSGEASMASAVNTAGDEAGCISKTNKIQRAKLALYIFLITVFIGALAYLGIRFGAEITTLAREPDRLSKLLDSYGWKGVLVFIGIQILQVVVAAIPGEVVQIAGGYIYGTWMGTLYSMTGIFLGSVFVFSIARLIGYPVVKLAVSDAQIEKFNFMINSSKSEIALFILFLIPGIPKDIVTYIAGITPVKPIKFFAIILIGRFPALLASSYIGHSAQTGNYLMVIILSAAAVILFVSGLLLKNRIISKIHQLSRKKDG